MTDPQETQQRQQRLRLRRFAMALATYGLGSAILALAAALGLMGWGEWVLVMALFLLASGIVYALLRSGWNLRRPDPSLTGLQVAVGALQVFAILVLAPRLHFAAAPFYSVLFVFAMLRLRPRQMAGLAAWVLGSYLLAQLIRQWRFGDLLDNRVELINGIVVAASCAWFSFAAGFISSLRARLRAALEENTALATQDALTGLANRRRLDALLHSELERSHRLGGGFSVLMVDIDHFKRVNDRLGHSAGDAALREAAACMAGALRSVDTVGRFGGEEFLVLLPGDSLAQARACAERLREAVARLRPPALGGGAITVSLGVAQYRSGDDAQSLLARADAALYRAKAGGRNRVEDQAPAEAG